MASNYFSSFADSTFVGQNIKAFSNMFNTALDDEFVYTRKLKDYESIFDVAYSDYNNDNYHPMVWINNINLLDEYVYSSTEFNNKVQELYPGVAIKCNLGLKEELFDATLNNYEPRLTINHTVDGAIVTSESFNVPVLLSYDFIRDYIFTPEVASFVSAGIGSNGISITVDWYDTGNTLQNTTTITDIDVQLHTLSTKWYEYNGNNYTTYNAYLLALRTFEQDDIKIITYYDDFNTNNELNRIINLPKREYVTALEAAYKEHNNPSN